ncbi:Predicted metal-dependent hydrolase, TIM-barrel fold [Salegentibacter echinorum]|uniref:Predicted metal-dependent hydrolase, TIM-barrel fold n=1 Tax=Salegentibacter echinorum TaxID=1073325 RepID=A0A1M5E9R7_SALEC|nr:amidohydrolase family protein [Salegentibacter echinorum]SHF75979.1 Predicted metal-dependent hydrolase, TIM-barrel fold [Salegentibacter echinorum]
MIDNFIDAHVHLNTKSTAKIEMAKVFGARFLSINTTIPFFEGLKGQEAVIQQLQQEYPNRIAYITSFDNKYWNTKEWLPRALSQIENGVANGAVGVKIWKNIGMDKNFKDDDGNFVMIDDSRFNPIFEYLIENDILLVGHQGEPRNCWLALDEMTVESDREYFLNHPEYYMHSKPNYPSYERHMQARDNVLRKYPDLKFVGLHLFSLEYNLEEVAKRLEEFPNSKTDVAGRICHVQFQAMQNREKVRDFFIEYQDRIIYGTDVIDDGSMKEKDLAEHFRNLWLYHWEFFSTSKVLEAPQFEGSFRGLALPETILEKLFRVNAQKTYGFKNNCK